MKSIFVSSTFRDMHEERDILHERVVPELNEYAAQYGESISLCDLRWGVNTEDLESREGAGKVLSVCLDEIDRCRPYMLVILGERYGWIPDSETMRAAEENRNGLNLDDLEKSVTALEIEYGALKTREQTDHTLFYFREIKGTFPEEYGKEDVFHERKLSELKARIRRFAGKNLHTYTVRWDSEKQSLEGIDVFAGQVTEDLKNLMEEDWKKCAALTSYGKDQRFQWNYAEQKAVQFRARENLIAEYTDMLNHGQKILALTGAAGSGKSTLMGRLAVKLREEGKEVLPIFCGSTAFCRDAFAVIRYIVHFIEELFSLEHFEDNHVIGETGGRAASESSPAGQRNRSEIDRWTDRLAEMCAEYVRNTERELVILLDAVDQLFADEARNQMRFIPAIFPDNIKIVCSFLDTFHPGYHNLLRKTEVIRPLAKSDKQEVIEGILQSQKKELAVPVIKKMIEKEESDNPLYLSLAAQRLVMMDRRDFEKIVALGDGINAITAHQMEIVDHLPEDLDDLCMNVLHAAAGKLGGNMAELAAQYIAVSRYGLRETDLESIFTASGTEWNSLDFALFIHYMRGFFLQRKDGRWDFVHRCIRDGFQKHSSDEVQIHREILEHLKGLDQKDEVRMNEMVYHCYKADEKKYFVKYISKYNYVNEIIRPAAETICEISIQDNGEWLCDVIRNGKNYDAGHNFIAFLNFKINECFDMSQKGSDIRFKIFEAVSELASMLEQREKSDESLRDLSICYENIGIVSMLLGGESNLAKAREMYEKSLDIRKFLALEKRIPGSSCDLSVSCFKLGEVYEACGGRENLELALKMYKKALGIDKILARVQGTSENRRVLSVTYERTGGVFEALDGRENLERALEMYEESMIIRETLCKELNTVQSRNDLSASYERAGGVYAAQGGRENLERALKMFEKSIMLREVLSREQRTSVNLWNLAAAYDKAGELCAAQGGRQNLEKAERLYEKAANISEYLSKELGTAESLRNLGVSYQKKGAMYMMHADRESLEKAREMFEKSLELLKSLAEKQGTDKNLRDLSCGYENAGMAYMAEGSPKNLKKAQKMYEASLKIRKSLAEKRNTIESWRDLSIGYVKMGEVYEAQEGPENLRCAQRMYEESLVILKVLSEMRRTPESSRDLSISYEKMGIVYEMQGGRENLERALEMYEKCLEIRKEVSEKQRTAVSFRDLHLSYLRVGTMYEARGGQQNLRRAQEMCEKSLQLAEALLKEQGTAESLHDLFVCCDTTGRIYEAQGDHENQKKAQQMYEKSMQLAGILANKLKTVESYDEWAVSLARTAAFPLTAPEMSRRYLKTMLSISEILYQSTGSTLYQEYMEYAKEMLDVLS